jgi:dTDP-4-dehydrorhamnose 3,5-epimerase
MKVIETPLPDLKVVQSSTHRDERGTFTRLFCARELQPLLGERQIVQINHSRTSKPGAIRGLHFQQPPHAEMKMVRCLRGRVWDVAVDLRFNSPTFLQWHAIELTADDANMLVIPEGFAHGFQALAPASELLYLHTDFYSPQSEGGVRHDDPALKINWPLAPQDLSPRDLTHPLLANDFSGVML